MKTVSSPNKKPARDMGAVLPGYKINEYLLVLQPHEELRNKIAKVKNDFAVKYQTDAARWGKPHLTLVNFMQYQMLEERLINRLSIIAMGSHPIKVELKDYGSLPSHSIYINITSKLPVQNLIKEIRTGSQQLMKINNDNKPHFIMEPHIVIGRKLQPWQYEKSYLEYSHKSFTGRFIADNMLLLKRPLGELKYEIVKRFEFENLPVSTRQGDLFGAEVY
jgi:2'-5' RNA ligase